MFSSKTLQFFLGITAFAAISSPTSVLAASGSRRMAKRSLHAEPEVVTLTTIRDFATGDKIILGATSAYPGGNATGIILTPDIVEGPDAADHTVIGTSDWSCKFSRLGPIPTVLCEVVACLSPDDCIFIASRGVVVFSGCPVPQTGTIVGGTGAYSGITGSLTTTSDCTINENLITDTVVLLIDA